MALIGRNVDVGNDSFNFTKRFYFYLFHPLTARCLCFVFSNENLNIPQELPGVDIHKKHLICNYLYKVNKT